LTENPTITVATGYQNGQNSTVDIFSPPKMQPNYSYTFVTAVVLKDIAHPQQVIILVDLTI
jgi:hypothetical protein